MAAFTWAAQAQAQVIWSGLGDGTTWGDNANWVGGSKPTGTNTPQLEGATVTVDTVESYTGMSATGADGALIIDDGGELTANASTTALRYINGITINSGGKLFSAPTNNIRSAFLTINEGGELTGTGAIFDGDTITVGGIFRPRDSIDGANEFVIGSGTTTGNFYMTATGALYLDVFGNGVNESIVITDSSSSVSNLDLSLGTIVLSTQSYTPQIGDSFDLWTDNMSGGEPNNVTPGDGSNIILSGYQLDLSQWATDGIVTVVPEPQSVIYVALAGLAVFAIRRRRR